MQPKSYAPRHARGLKRTPPLVPAVTVLILVITSIVLAVTRSSGSPTLAADQARSLGVTVYDCMQGSTSYLQLTSQCPQGTVLSWSAQEAAAPLYTRRPRPRPTPTHTFTPSPTPTTPTPTPTTPTPTPTTPTPTPTTPSPTPSCGAVQPSWAPTGCLPVTFDDEFNGTTLSTAWTPGWFGTGITGPVNRLECARYNSANVTVSGGYLHLAMQNGYGAIVSSNPLGGASPGFQMTYGSVEFRAYLPPLNGSTGIANWPALWLDGHSWPADGEFDVVEGLHGTAMWHIPTDGNVGGGGPAGPYSGWHTFGVMWTSSHTVTFYYDGQQAGIVNNVPNNQPMYLIMGNQCGSSTEQSPTDMLVDWVRAWS